MPRPFKRRHVNINPEITRFNPKGNSSFKNNEIELDFDELEAMRLKDYAGFDQDKSAKKMKVSTSTFQRILYSGRKKVVEALLFGKAIEIENRKGVVIMPGLDGTGPAGQGPMTGGARGKCGTGKGAGRGMGAGRGQGRGRGAGFGGPATECICPACNERIVKKPGVPCSQIKCEKCGGQMVRAN